MNVWEVPVEVILKLVLDESTTIVCAAPVKLLIAVIPVPAIIPLCCVTVNITDGIDGCGDVAEAAIIATFILLTAHINWIESPAAKLST